MDKKCWALILSGMLLWVLPGVALSMRSGGPGEPGAPAVPFAIAGTVTDSQGKPVPGAKVVVYQIYFRESPSVPTINAVAETTTGPDGNFTFPADKSEALYSGGCVVASKEGSALGWAVPSRQGEQRFDITLDEPKDLSGVVVDEQGQPVAEAEVSIAAAMSGRAEDQENMRAWIASGFFNAKTDHSGRFVFAGLPAGATFEFLVSKPGYTTTSTRSPTFTGPAKLRFQFAPGQVGIKLALPRETGIQGVVVEKATGQPVRGMALVAEPAFGLGRLPMPPQRVVSGADGTFRIGDLSEGDYYVRLSTGPTAKWAAEPVPVTLTTGQMKSDVKIQLVPGGVIEVLVKDAAGQPITRAQASIHIQAIRREGPTFRASTDVNGVARLRIAPGQYILSDIFVVEQARLEPNGQRITVAEGEAKRIECAVGATPKFAGIVRDEAGNPLAGVKIEVLPPIALRMEIASDASGGFEATWNPPVGSRDRTFVLVARDVARNLAAAVDFNGPGVALDVSTRQ